jgi:cell shape-determining protein MreC
VNNNSKTKLMQRKVDIKNNNVIKISSTNKNSNNSSSNNINNEDLNEIKNLKKRYIELLQENKKLKEDLSKINNSRQKKKINTVCSGTPSKEISSFVKRCTSATKKNIFKNLYL